MKRVFTFLTLAAALVAVSCAKEQENPYEGGSMVTYTIDGPAQVATKAMGTIGTAYTLYYEVRLWDGSVLGNKLEGTGLSGSKVIAANAWPTTVSFDLARGKQYKILFWAQSNTAPAGLYDCSDLTAIAIDYSKMAASNEDCDAFYGSDVIIPAGATSAAATLQRPFALVNLGTNDAVQFKTASGGCTVGDVEVTVKGNLASSFNVATGAPGAGASTNFSPNAAPIDAFDAHTLVVNATEYNYLSAVYVLPATASDVIEVDYTIKDNTNANITTLDVQNVPVKANHRTNITGKLLTGATTYAIGVDQAFAGNTNKVVGPTFANVTALNDYFATLADNSDNGDINPEEVTLAAIAAGETITLPAIAGGVVIRITGTLATGTLNIAYADSGDKPANLSLFVAQLEKLVANITSTHFTLLSGSHITDTADVHTSGSTFVIEQGAKVGTVNIHQGNAEIAGEVAKVAVPAGASADGDGAPVQVFLTKKSAVKQVELNAKTDVVVEQPKDNINESDTEHKVEVVVMATAENSSATAQNGGAIYVKAYADCSVVSDGKSTAEEGSVSSNVTIAEVATDPDTGEPTVEIAASQSGEGTITTADEKVQSAVETNVAMIGETKYDSFSGAFDAAIAADGPVVIKMINNTKFDIVVDSKTAYKTIPVGKDITLDLNGFNITTSADSKLTALIVNRGTLTITDTSVGAYGTLTHGGTLNWIYDGGNDFSGSYTTNVITNNGTVNLLAGSVINISRGSACYAVDNNSNAVNAVLNVRGGYLKGDRVAVRQFCNSANHNNDVIVSGGEIYGGYSGIWVQLPGSNASSMKRAHLAVTGGVLEGGSYAFYDYSFGDGWDNVNYEITGGKLVGEIYSYKPNYKFVTGGTFTKNPSSYVPEGYEAIQVEGGLWTVVSDPGYIFENDVVTIYAAHGLSYVSYNYADFRDASHNLTIKLSEDIDMTGRPFSSFNVNNYTSAQKDLVLFTFDGQNHTITGLEKMLISRTWAGHSSFEVKNLTLEDANIVEDENDANENVGVGAICGWAEASSSCKIINVSLLNSSVIGGHWTGGLVGYAAGYDNPNDGPVLEKFTVANCTVEGCTIKGKGSVGALVAHAAGNNATLWEVENFTSKDNTLLNTASKTDRTGALIGTLGLTTGISTAYPESKVGVYFTSPLTVSGNTVNGMATDARKIGRKGSSDDDKCYLDNENVVDAWLAN